MQQDIHYCSRAWAIDMLSPCLQLRQPVTCSSCLTTLHLHHWIALQAQGLQGVEIATVDAVAFSLPWLLPWPAVQWLLHEMLIKHASQYQH